MISSALLSQHMIIPHFLVTAMLAACRLLLAALHARVPQAPAAAGGRLAQRPPACRPRPDALQVRSLPWDLSSLPGLPCRDCAGACLASLGNPGVSHEGPLAERNSIEAACMLPAGTFLLEGSQINMSVISLKSHVDDVLRTVDAGAWRRCLRQRTCCSAGAASARSWCSWQQRRRPARTGRAPSCDLRAVHVAVL